MSGSTSSGQGHETVLAQVCADALGLAFDRIRIICASTDELEDGFGTWHSRSAVMAGNAVLKTAQDFSSRRERSPRIISAGPTSRSRGATGRSSAPMRNPTHAAETLAGFAAGRGETIDVAATFEHTGQKPFSYGTHAAHVAVDPRTGEVRLVDFVAVEDIGRVINPLVAHGQALGAIVQGLGGVFLEHLPTTTRSVADRLPGRLPAARGH